MKSALRSDIEGLRRDATSAAHRHAFEAGRARAPALAAHPNVASVLAMLDDAAEDTYAAREALAHALLLQYRTTHATLWASLLLSAFKPMLVRLRSRLLSDSVPGEDLDQLVLSSFLAALTEVPLADRLAMRLRQHTERQVFTFLRKERQQRRHDVDVDELEDVEPDAVAPHFECADEVLRDVALLIQRAAQEGVSTSGFDIVEATVLRREALHAYVERLKPGDDAARKRLYQRIKRQRARAMQRLKALHAASSTMRRPSSS